VRYAAEEPQSAAPINNSHLWVKKFLTRPS
jgi:hypothetical protein